MLHIIWVIIKIIGFLLFGIVGLLLGLLLLILFVPIRYRLKLSYYGEVKGIVKITWLLHMISVTISYDQDTNTIIRIFGINLSKRKQKRVDETLEDMEEELEKNLHLETEAVQKNTGETRMQLDDAIPAPEGDWVPEEELRQDEMKKSAKVSLIQKVTAKFKSLWNQMKTAVMNLYQKFRNLMSAGDAYIRLIQNETNQKTLKLILKNSKALLCHLLPQKVSGTVTFGFDDPYTTGQVLSIASIFYAMCCGRFQFIPVFDETILEGEADLKGRIRLGTISLLLIQVYMNKNFRQLLKKWQSR